MTTAQILLIVGPTCLVIGLVALFGNFFGMIKSVPTSLDGFSGGLLRHVIAGAWCVGSAVVSAIGVILFLIDYAKK